MFFTAASTRRVIEMFWLHFSGTLSPVFIKNTYVQIEAALLDAINFHCISHTHSLPRRVEFIHLSIKHLIRLILISVKTAKS